MRGLMPACECQAMARTSIRIDLDSDELVDSPLGTARLPYGTSHTFHGWMALAEAIDALATLAATDGASASAARPVPPTPEPEVPST